MTDRIPDGPETVHELLDFLDSNPESAHLYRPSPFDARMMGIDWERFQKPEPFSESFRRRLIATCRDDADFCSAFRMMLNGGEA